MAGDAQTYTLDGQSYTVPAGTSMDELDGYIKQQSAAKDPLVTGKGMEHPNAPVPQPWTPMRPADRLKQKLGPQAVREGATPALEGAEAIGAVGGLLAPGMEASSYPEALAAISRTGIGAAGGAAGGRWVGREAGGMFGPTGAEWGGRVGGFLGGLLGGHEGYKTIPEAPPELGSPENPGFHAKLPTRMPATPTVEPELGSPENPGFHAKLPTRMPEKIAPVPELGSPENPGWLAPLPNRMPEVAPRTPELGSPENPGFHAKLPARMPAIAPSIPELGTPENPGFMAKLPTRMPKAPEIPGGTSTKLTIPGQTLPGPRFTGSEGTAARWTNERVLSEAARGNRVGIEQVVRRGLEPPPNMRYVAGSPDLARAEYNPREVTRFDPEGTPIRQSGQPSNASSQAPLGRKIGDTLKKAKVHKGEE